MIDKFPNGMILYRSVGLQELDLIYESGMKAFPARLPQQPIFYPVLQLEYARQIATDWNARNGQFAGYVTQFKIDEQYIGRFETHMVGESQHQEFWIPAEQVEEFNRHILGHIKVLEAYFGDGFQGFVPDTFGLQGKNAVEQFTLLANSYIYKRMDFYLEIKRNHKAVFLNYPFWQKYDFKNPGLREKVLQAIREAWLTSFPKNPLPMPSPESTPSGKEAESPAPAAVPQVDAPVGSPDPQPLVQPAEIPAREDSAPAEQIAFHFAQGVELGLRGETLEAIAELSRAVEEDPRHVAAQTSLGVAFHRRGEDDRALSCYEAALRIDPIHAEAHYFRANILFRQGNVREAIAAYTVAIGLEPELIESHQRPVPQDRLTDYVPAPAEMVWIARPAHRILELNKGLEAQPRQASHFKERAAAYARLRNYVQAIADYSSSLEIQPDDARALHLRGLAYEQLGQFDRALEDYQRAIAIDPGLSDVYIQHGVTLGKMGNFRQSIASLTEAIRLAPRKADGYFNRGLSYYQQGDLERAIDDFSTVIRLAPGDEDAYYWRGLSKEEAGRQPEAIADYKQFLETSQNAGARQEVERRLGQWGEAKPGPASRAHVPPDDRQKMLPVPASEEEETLEFYDLILALGERALHSTWFASGVESQGEKMQELHAMTDEDKPVEGADFLRITSGIRQTRQGDFQAFETGAESPWIFIRAWQGDGFYIETDDPRIREQLLTRFPLAEDVQGARPPYMSLFIRI